ncbi:MAG: MFS transporter [Syntrophobacteraceae bacterium]
MKRFEIAYYLAFALLELSAAVEVTAMLVAAPHIAEILGLSEVHTGWVLNAYLYPVFFILLIFLVRKGYWLKKIFSPGGLFITGLGLFAAGNIFSALSTTPFFFFTGRILQAFGGAMAYLGQLWTATLYFGDRLVSVMFWGECGLAVGIISGPLIAGCLLGWGPSGWRIIFILNAALALLILALAGIYEVRRNPIAELSASKGLISGQERQTYLLLGLQCAVMAGAVGGEYLLSNQLQLLRGISALYVGCLTAAASLGAVAGSALVAARPANTNVWLRAGWAATLAALPALGFSLALLPTFCNAPILFLMGMGMGMSSVSIFARIAEVTPESDFVRVSILYLLVQQLGNALGIQIVEITTGAYHNPVTPTLFLAAPLILLFLFGRLSPKGEKLDAAGAVPPL